MKVTNGGTVPCEVNVGTSQMEFLVTSGADRIFSSKDCQSASEDLIKTIAPGASETANFPWHATGRVEGCQAVAAKPGARRGLLHLHREARLQSQPQGRFPAELSRSGPAACRSC